MSVQLNHTIVWCRDRRASSAFLAAILGLAEPVEFGPFYVVELSNAVSLDYHDHSGPIASQHYAFLIDEVEFDQVFERIRDGAVPYWADPVKLRPGEVYTNAGGRGLYFGDPDGHLLEIMTMAYPIGKA